MLIDGIDLVEGSDITNLTVVSGDATAQGALTPTDGEIFFRSDLNEFQVYYNSTWQTMGTAGTLTSHVNDATTHLTSNQNTLLDGLSGTLTFTHLNAVEGVTSGIQGQLNAKAPIASPALTGNPTAPTQSPSDNSTNIATTAYVDAGGGGISVAVLTGTISNGGTIPLPSGYTQAQCKWTVSMANTNGSSPSGGNLGTLRVFASASRVVTCQWTAFGPKSPTWQSEDANYIIIGVK